MHRLSTYKYTFIRNLTVFLTVYSIIMKFSGNLFSSEIHSLYTEKQ